MTIIFRCNASPSVGFGHLTRCRALAHALQKKGSECVMVGPITDYANDEDKTLFKEWIIVDDWESSLDDATHLIQVAIENNAKWLVLDDYRIDEEYQLALKTAGLHWLQFDGFANKPIWADIVINANPAAKVDDYTHVLRNPDCKLLLGPKYAVLRQEFLDIKPRESHRPLRQVLVTFGGGDDRGAIQFVLEALVPTTPAEIQIVVVSGKNNPNNDHLVKWVSENGDQRVNLHIDPDNVAELFAASDLAVMAGGTTTYEVLRCGVPMILISIAENQIQQSVAWSKIGVAAYLGSIQNISKNDITSCYQNFFLDANSRRMLESLASEIGAMSEHKIHSIIIE